MSGPTQSPGTPEPARPKITKPGTAPGGSASASEYTAIQQSPEFKELRSKYRSFVIPVTVGALVFYFTYVLLAAYASGFMGEKVVGNITVGLIFGLLQFVMVFGITTLYVRFASTQLDPRAEAIRAAHSRLDTGAGR